MRRAGRPRTCVCRDSSTPGDTDLHVFNCVRAFANPLRHNPAPGCQPPSSSSRNGPCPKIKSYRAPYTRFDRQSGWGRVNLKGTPPRRFGCNADKRRLGTKPTFSPECAARALPLGQWTNPPPMARDQLDLSSMHSSLVRTSSARRHPKEKPGRFSRTSAEALGAAGDAGLDATMVLLPTPNSSLSLLLSQSAPRS